jgi:hypothetical protein
MTKGNLNVLPLQATGFDNISYSVYQSNCFKPIFFLHGPDDQKHKVKSALINEIGESLQYLRSTVPLVFIAMALVS